MCQGGRSHDSPVLSLYLIDSPRIVPVLEENLSVSTPRRWSIDT
jgi:hypothetical protein